MSQTVTGTGLGIHNTTTGGYGPKGSAALGQGGESVYVNAANGNLILRQSDGFLASTGLGFDLLQTYNSRGELNGSWCFNVNSRLELTGKANSEGSFVIRIDEDGHRSRFVWDNIKQTYRSEEGTIASLKYSSNGWIYHEGNSRISWHYDLNGQLKSLQDKDGHALTFHYDAQGKLDTITDKSNKQSITWTFDHGLLQDITTISEKRIVHHLHYEYDEQQRLIRVSRDLEEGETYWISYDYEGDSNHITDIRQSDGTSLHIDYDTQGRVKQLVDGQGRITKYTYAQGKTIVSDLLGESWAYIYDEQERLTGIEGPEGYHCTYEYKDTRLVHMTEGSQNWDFAYNENGDCIRIEAPNGLVTTRIFDEEHHLLAETKYLSSDNKQSKTIRYVYNEEGHLRFKIDVDGVVTEYRYNNDGLLQSNRCYVLATYNLSNLKETDLLTQNDLNGWVTQQNPENISLITYSYDWRGQLTEEIHYSKVDAEGIGIDENAIHTSSLYDAAGRLIEKTVLTSTGASTTHYVYDDLGRLRHTWNNQHQQWFEYDDAMQRIIQTDANGLKTIRYYDKSGLLIASHRLNELHDYGTVSYQYDDAGRLCAETGVNGLTTYYFYDAEGHICAQINDHGQLTEYRYNQQGLLIQTHQYAQRINTKDWLEKIPLLEKVLPQNSSKDLIKQTIYNQYQQIAYTIDSSGAIIGYSYDAEGNIRSKTAYAQRLSNYSPQKLLCSEDIQIQTDKNDRTLNYYYDLTGRLQSEINGEGYATEYRYNNLGLLVETCHYQTKVSLLLSGEWSKDRPKHNTKDIHTYSLYDKQGRKIADIDGERYLIEYRYNSQNLLEEKIAYATQLSSKLKLDEYTDLEQLRPQNANNDHHTSFSYSETGQLLEEQTHQGLLITYSYDEMGNLTSKTRKDVNTQKIRQERFRYDALGRIIQQLDELGCAKLALPNTTEKDLELIWQQHSIRFEYDNSGLLLSKTDALDHTTRYFYNEQR